MTTNSKEWIQYYTAALMVVSGVVLSFISFFTKGDVTDGVLWYMAQAGCWRRQSHCQSGPTAASSR